MEVTNRKLDDTIQYQQLTAEYLDEAIKLAETAFVPYENLHKTLGTAKDPQAIAELRQLLRLTAKEGVSVIAIDKSTGKVVGVMFNEIQKKGDTVIEDLIKSWKSERSKALMKFLSGFYKLYDVFDHCRINCIFDIFLLTTAPEYRRRGIGKKLSEMTVELAEKLAKGINVKKSLDGTELSLEPKPEAIRSISTTFITQKIGKLQGFEFPVEKRFDELDFCDLNFADVIGSGTTKIVLRYKKL